MYTVYVYVITCSWYRKSSETSNSQRNQPSTTHSESDTFFGSRMHVVHCIRSVMCQNAWTANEPSIGIRIVIWSTVKLCQGGLWQSKLLLSISLGSVPLERPPERIFWGGGDSRLTFQWFSQCGWQTVCALWSLCRRICLSWSRKWEQ